MRGRLLSTVLVQCPVCSYSTVFHKFWAVNDHSYAIRSHVLLPCLFTKNSLDTKDNFFSYRLEKFHSEGVARIVSTFNNSLQRLTMELETGGNVRFDDGNLNDQWLVEWNYL